jgi:hypothetical protein
LSKICPPGQRSLLGKPAGVGLDDAGLARSGQAESGFSAANSEIPKEPKTLHPAMIGG